LTLSVFKSESNQKYENKYDIDDIRPYLIHFHIGVFGLFFILLTPKALFSSQKILQNFSDFSSHRIFRRMHEVLNIDKNKN